MYILVKNVSNCLWWLSKVMVSYKRSVFGHAVWSKRRKRSRGTPCDWSWRLKKTLQIGVLGLQLRKKNAPNRGVRFSSRHVGETEHDQREARCCCRAYHPPMWALHHQRYHDTLYTFTWFIAIADVIHGHAVGFESGDHFLLTGHAVFAFVRQRVAWFVANAKVKLCDEGRTVFAKRIDGIGCLTFKHGATAAFFFFCAVFVDGCREIACVHGTVVAGTAAVVAVFIVTCCSRKCRSQDAEGKKEFFHRFLLMGYLN